MGRPPSNGGPSFRFNPTEVAEMQGVLQAHNCVVPQREILEALAEKFSNSAERAEKPAVQMKQVWNWFQNRRHALKSKSEKPPVKSNVSPILQHDLATARSVSQEPQKPSVPAANATNVPQVPQSDPTPPVQSAGRDSSNNSQMEFEAKSARDGAWYDVATFLSHRSMETTDPEVLVRFAGFGSEEDEWVNARKHVRQRSLPCESSECVVVLPGDLILGFQEGKEQALYFDAYVLDAQRRRHDVRGCRCRFLVRYDHDQSEEIVPLRKICRRPETDYRMCLLHAESVNMKQNKTISEPHTDNSVKAYLPPETTLKQSKVEGPAETIPKLANAEVHAYCNPLPTPISHANIPITTSMVPIVRSSEPLASTRSPSPHSNVSLAPTAAPEDSGIPGATIVAPFTSNVPVAPTAAAIANSSIHATSTVAPVAFNVPLAPSVAPVANSSVPGATITSNVSVAQALALVANSSLDMSPNMAAPADNSSVPIAPNMAPASNSSVTLASTAEAAISNSSVPVAMTTEAPVATNSSVPLATSEAPVASNIPAVTEIKILLEKVYVSCIADNVGNMDAQPMNLAKGSGTDTSAGRGDTMQQL